MSRPEASRLYRDIRLYVLIYRLDLVRLNKDLFIFIINIIPKDQHLIIETPAKSHYTTNFGTVGSFSKSLFTAKVRRGLLCPLDLLLT